MASDDERRDRLTGLLAPLHDRARATARRLCRSNAEGDDLFHEAVLRAFDRLGELRDESSFRAWFYAVMLSVHRARHRRGLWRRFLSLDEADVEPLTEGEADGREGAERMTRALATLSAEAREAIVLFTLEGMSLEEVASLQGASLSAIKSRLSRARGRLRLHYERTDAAMRSRAARVV